ncbi:MAG: hypothetical protein IIX06_01275 [Bacteroidales bacterium]|nr:hypothetical protein [Bacteroidales bacterium]
MEQKNNKDNSVIFEIESLLNKMSNQVNFLIRKEMPMNQLDIDLLMENTRKLYDTICSVELGVRSVELGVEGNTDSDTDTDTDFELIELSTDELIDSDTDSEEDDEDADMVWDFTRDDEELGVRSEELGVEGNTDSDSDTDAELIDLSTDELIDSDTDSAPEPEPEPEPEEPEEEDSGIRTYRIVRENVPTLGDLLEKTEDNSLAARLQRKPVSDLISAIGINDKFLFLNELFGGSMEKYNKSIRSLNSFSTLLGAKTYMSELQIEFQWDCSSDAYKKLADLVERRFI